MVSASFLHICLVHSKENKRRSALSLSLRFLFSFMIVRHHNYEKVYGLPAGSFTSLPAPTQNLPGVSISSPFYAGLLPGPTRRYSCIHPLCGSVVCAGMLFSLYSEWPLWSNYWQEDEVVPLFQSWWLTLLSTTRHKGPCLIPSKLTSNRDDPTGRYNNLGMHRYFNSVWQR